LIETTNAGQEIENSIVTESSQSSQPAKSVLERVIASPYLHMGLLILLVALCFGRTLSSYFLADDFGEVAYVSRIFSGEPQLFWSNFSGNYMQIPGMNVYRPWLLVSLVVDFLLYKANATGYYFTNLSFFAGGVLLIYFVTRHLTSEWSRTRSAVAAFFGAALFAASPLRCESVSWVVGRVDIVCCFFYLLSFFLFLKSRVRIDEFSNANSLAVEKPVTKPVFEMPDAKTRTIYRAFGVLTFFLAMGTKEMAIGLPVLLTVTGFLGIGAGASASSRSLTQKLRDAAVFSAPLWISTVIYFIVRYLALGTFGGGYVAGFGASQLSFMVQRWLDPDTIKRLFFPLCHSLFSNVSVYGQLLTACYGALFGLGLIRLAEKKLSLQWFLFLTAWMITAAVPIFQLWGLGFDLEGSRFYFFLSVPLCLMAPILLFRPSANVRTTAELKILVATAVTLTAIICVLGRVACLTDLEWVHAGKENRQVSVQAQKLAESHKHGLLPVLGIPKERNGAHQILNGSTFGTMLNPPFTSQAFSNRFATFDPIMFGPPEYIDASRFKTVLHDSAGEFYVWDSDSSSFKNLKLDLSSKPVQSVSLPVVGMTNGWLPHTHSRAAYRIQDSVIRMTSMQEGDSVRIGDLNVNPLAADFLEFEYKATDVPDGANMTIYASGADPSEAEAVAHMSKTDSFKIVRVRLSRYWKWFCQGEITALTVQPYPCAEIVMRNFRLLSSNLLCPTIEVLGAQPDNAGIAHVDSQNVTVKLSPRDVKEAAFFAIEIGKVNYFFNNFEKVTTTSPVEATVQTSVNASEVHIDGKNFATPGFYELRARCLDSHGKPVGEYSDNLTLRIGQPQSTAMSK
jgi:hypothetical protein